MILIILDVDLSMASLQLWMMMGRQNYCAFSRTMTQVAMGRMTHQGVFSRDHMVQQDRHSARRHPGVKVEASSSGCPLQVLIGFCLTGQRLTKKALS